MMTSRIWFTAAQKAELWERWKNGQSAAAISRARKEEQDRPRTDIDSGATHRRRTAGSDPTAAIRQDTVSRAATCSRRCGKGGDL
jgi:hypothetical protein